MHEEINLVHNSTHPVLKELYMAYGQKNVYSKNDHIIMVNDPWESCYYIEKGLCTHIYSSYDGQNRAFGLLTSGSSFGEPPCVLKKKSNRSILCLEKTEVRELPFKTLIANIDKSFTEEFMQYVLNQAVKCIISMSLFGSLNVVQRILVFFKAYANQLECSISDWYTMDIKLTHEHFAELVNSSRVNVTMLLNSLREQGYIGQEGGYMCFHKTVIDSDFIFNKACDIRWLKN